MNTNPIRKDNMVKYACLLAFFFILTFAEVSTAQTVGGNLSELKQQNIELHGFNGLSSYLITKSTIDVAGNFQLAYTAADYGMGYLISADEKPFFIVLSGEDIVLSAESFSNAQGTVILKGKENQSFEQFALAHPRREQALSVWYYLERIYSLDSLFSIHSAPVKAIKQEKKRIKDEDQSFLASLPANSYVYWYLPMRKLLSSISAIAQYRSEEVPATLQALRKIDYSDQRLHKSGLLKDAIENHFWLIENSGISLEMVYEEMQHSIDTMMIHLLNDEKKLNLVADYLFDLLERHSLFPVSEYLALKLLNETSCTINSDLAKQMETYRAMKKGNTAPDILKDGKSVFSTFQSAYTLVVFAASWCNTCTREVPEISKLYPKWKQQQVEVILVSLDDQQEAYQSFVKDLTFVAVCDFKKWESQYAKDYYVFGTPTMFLLDAKRTILLRPNSVKQMDAWVDWFLVEGKK